MKHSISHAALLIGALSAFSTGALAQAQVPFTNDENATALTVTLPGGGIATKPGAPYTGAPGSTPTTSGAYILEGVNNSGPITTSVANAVTALGAPNVTYANESGATGAYVAPTGGGLATVGGTYAAGDYVINTSTGALRANTTGCTVPTCSYVAPSSVDPTVSWTTVKYTNETAYATAYQGTGGNLNKVLVDSKGNMIQTGALGTINLGGAAPAGYSWVLNGNSDPTATAKSVAAGDYAFTRVQALAVIGNSQSIAGPGSLVQQNTNAAGKVIASTGVGPAGVSVYDGVAGHTTSVGAGLVTVTNGANPAAYIKLDATVDPVLTVTNGTPAGTTVINNGTVTVGTSVTVGTGTNLTSVSGGGVLATDGVNAGVVTPTGVGVVNANGAAGAVVQSSGSPALAVYGPTAVPQFSASSDGTISAEGNRIQNVGTPLNPGDAVNKSYVDTGLNNLQNYTNQQVTKLGNGVASAMALGAGPDRTGGQTWALDVSGSFYDKYSAIGLNGITSVGNFGGYDIALGGGVAFAGNGQVSGVVKGQIAGGGGYVPLK